MAGFLARPVLHDLRGPQLLAPVDQVTLVARRVRKIASSRRSHTAHDGDLVVAEEEAVTGGARRDAVAEESVLAGIAEPEALGAGGHDEGLGLVGGFGGLRVAHPDAERRVRQVDAADLLVQELGGRSAPPGSGCSS